MSRRLLAGGLLVAVLVVGGLGAAISSDIGPTPGSEPSFGSNTEALPSETDDEAAAAEPFAFAVEGIDDCGETCRDVTATVENSQDEPAESVTVSTSIFAGENSTEELVWEGTEAVGTLDGGDSTTTTKRVDLSLSEAYAIDETDGWITIVTTIDSEEETVTVRESRQVG
ncbi:MAG: hypothetical protein U9O06_11965 [Euryarchaeota archaeon]|nr:hypothetical protein [Euryarchaeota archaeon]